MNHMMQSYPSPRSVIILRRKSTELSSCGFHLNTSEQTPAVYGCCDGWKIRPSGSWASERENFSPNSRAEVRMSQKSLLRTLNGSKERLIMPCFMAKIRGPTETIQVREQIQPQVFLLLTYNIILDVL